MERDLSLLRKKRVERERIANGLKAQPSPDEATRNSQLNENGHSEVSPAKDIHLSSGETMREDTIILDSTLEAGLIDSNDEPQAEASQNLDNDNNNAGDLGMPQATESSVGLAIPMQHDSTTGATELAKTPEKNLSGTTAVGEVPLDSSTADLDFESMFNDTDLTGGDDTMNFGLDFSSDGNLHQDVLNDSAFESIEMSNADMSNLGATTNEDINTLLPGLESYASAGTDFSNINIPVASTFPEPSQVAPVSTAGAPVQAAAQPAVADSSFDDIFGSADFSMDGTGDNNMGSGALGDFEDFSDDWFKTDQT